MNLYQHIEHPKIIWFIIPFPTKSQCLVSLALLGKPACVMVKLHGILEFLYDHPTMKLGILILSEKIRIFH